MAAPKAAWGIEIGSFAIKAIRLERDGDSVSVSDFMVIPHKKVLTTPDLDQDEMVRLGLGQFISQKSLEKEHLVMSVPGHAAFARFAKLPPVEPRKVPDIVKFEAVQQIPFPIDQVEWDYQTFTSEDSPEVEVGIFAITRERVQQRLSLYGELGLTPEALTLSPVSVYNAMHFDHDLKKNRQAVMYIDIGTQATDVIIAEDERCWIRTFPLGGTHFTEAIASAFKLSYSKAEKLKLEASTSKYAKQIMQAMRPVFSDLLQDLQRSIGYYQTLHRDAELTTIIGLGSTFKIPGLRKFVGQQLQLNVLRLDEYKKIAVAGREAASFAEHAVNFAPAYGLALQGVGLGPIRANLVPVGTLREQMWRSKTKWFAAAAVVVIAGAAVTLVRPFRENSVLSENPPAEVTSVVSTAKSYKSQYQSLQSQVGTGATAMNMQGLLQDREIWPHLVFDVAAMLQSAEPQPELTRGNVPSIPPAERRLVSLRNMGGTYRFVEGGGPAGGAGGMSGMDDGSGATTGARGGPRGSRFIDVTVEVELSHINPNEFLNTTIATWLRTHAEREGWPYRILIDSVDLNPEDRIAVQVGADGSLDPNASPTRTAAGADPARPAPGIGAAPPMPGGPARPASGSGVGGRTRTAGGGSVAAPGPGAGGLSSGPGSAPFGGPGFSPGGNPSGATPGWTPPGDNRPDRPIDPSGDQATFTRELAELESLAPVPGRPSPYPPGTTVYRVPITFTIEITVPQQTQPVSPAGDSTATAPTASAEESAS